MSAHLDFQVRDGEPRRVRCRGDWRPILEGWCTGCGQDISDRLTKQHHSTQDAAVAGSARRRYTSTPAPPVSPQTVPRGGLVVQEDK